MSTKSSKSNKKMKQKKISKARRNTMILSGGLATLTVAGLFTGILLFLYSKDKPTLNYGIFWNPVRTDPIWSGWNYDPISNLITAQITEGLFSSETYGTSSRIVPHLVESFSWSDDNLNLTCILREEITFHDGTLLTAQSVKWNIDRLHRIYTTEGLGDYAWQFPNGDWIVNKTVVINEGTIRFVLNNPFSPLPALLSGQYANIIKPNSTIENDKITIPTTLLCGTGPFKFESYSENESVVLLPYENYWNSPNANFNKIFFRIYDGEYENPTLHYAWQNDEIHIQYPQNPLDIEDLDYLRNKSNVVVREFKQTGRPSQIYLNCRLINSTMRKAITYAFNYTDFLDVGASIGYPAGRMESPMHHNLIYSDIFEYEVPWCNISRARQALLDVNWPGTSGLLADDNVSTGNPWEVIAESVTPLATHNFTHTGGFVNWLIYEAMDRDLKQIGVKLINDIRGGNDLRNARMNRAVEIDFNGWWTDYNDPHSAITQLFWNTSIENVFDVNDSQLQIWMEQGYNEQNEAIRAEIYGNIVKRIMEELYPFLMIYWDIRYDVHVSNLTNIPNPFEFGGLSLKDMKFI